MSGMAGQSQVIEKAGSTKKKNNNGKKTQTQPR